jgi:hypothetical protein
MTSSTKLNLGTRPLIVLPLAGALLVFFLIIVYLVYEEHAQKIAVEKISAEFLLTGQTGPEMKFDVIRETLKRLENECGASAPDAYAVAERWASVTSVTPEQRFALECLTLRKAH